MSALTKRMAKLELSSGANGTSSTVFSWLGTGEYTRVTGGGMTIDRKSGEPESEFMERAESEITEAAQKAGTVKPGVLWADRDGFEELQPYPAPRTPMSREERAQRFGNTQEEST